jgi:hypothetical protein
MYGKFKIETARSSAFKSGFSWLVTQKIRRPARFDASAEKAWGDVGQSLRQVMTGEGILRGEKSGKKSNRSKIAA